MIPIYIFDLDGTLANGNHRLHHITGEAKDWDAFFSECDKDYPIWPTIYLTQALKEDNCEVIIFTGRNEIVRDKTVDWLNMMGVFYHRLVMRGEDDRTNDDALKIKWYNQLLTDDQRRRVQCVFEDRTRVVNAWRNAGVMCCQVSQGDF